MRRHVAVLVLTLSLACDRSAPVAPVANGPSAEIVDGANGGNARFFFLPPLAPGADSTGTFDPAADPVVEICALTGSVCSSTIAQFSASSGSGSERVRVDGGEHYIVNWHTGDFSLDPATMYRISVFVHGIELGHADVIVGATGRALRGVDASQFVGVVNGQTLPIKFRIDVGAVQCDTVVTTSANNFVADVSAGMIRPLGNAIGHGFYLDTVVLFGSGLIVGTSGSDVQIGYNTASGASDFDGSQPVCAIQTAALLRTVATLRAPSGSIPGLAIQQESFSFTDPANADYLLLRYTMTNTGAATIAGLHAGYVADPDLYFDGVSPANDVIRFETGTGFPIGVASELDTLLHPGRFGIVPVAATPLTAFDGFTNGPPVPDPLTPAGFFAFLTGGIVAPPPGPHDIRQILGFGPVNLAPGQTMVFDFALVGGDSRTAFTAHAIAAHSKAVALGF